MTALTLASIPTHSVIYIIGLAVALALGVWAARNYP